MNHSLRIFLQFFRRDWYIFGKRLKNYLINYCLIYPTVFSLAFCYVIPSIFFGPNYTPQQGTLIFIGHALIMTIPLAFNLMIGLLFDLEHNRYIDYQITVLNPRLILIERILFSSSFIFCMASPFFPVAKLVMRDSLYTTQASWPLVYLMLYLAALCSAAYLQCMVCLIPNTRTLRRFWMRVNFILITLGGLFAPWYTIVSLSPVLGYLALLNPLLYITEGLRGAVLNDPRFLPAPICIVVLLIFSVVFTGLSFYFFKKRVDHI